jgi:hypothetical protein
VRRSGGVRRSAGGGRRTSHSRILDNLRLASRKGDRTALALALDEMRTLAFTPRYWQKYLLLVQHPLARLVDVLVIKQGDRIARQKGWVAPARRRARPAKTKRVRSPRAGRIQRPGGPDQPSLFPGL